MVAVYHFFYWRGLWTQEAWFRYPKMVKIAQLVSVNFMRSKINVGLGIAEKIGFMRPLRDIAIKLASSLETPFMFQNTGFDYWYCETRAAGIRHKLYWNDTAMFVDKIAYSKCRKSVSRCNDFIFATITRHAFVRRWWQKKKQRCFVMQIWKKITHVIWK